MTARAWCGLWLLLFVLPGWTAELRLKGDEAQVALSRAALAFEDREARLDIETVARTAAFAPRPELLRGGLSKSAIWLRFDIANDAPHALTRWLVVRPATLLDVQAFVPQEDGWRHMRAGSAIPFAERPVNAAVPAFPVTLAPGQTTTLYLRVAGPKAKPIQPVLWDPLEFRTRQGETRLFDGLLLGGLIVMTLVATLLLVLFRDRVFLFNALATGTYFLGEFNAKGYALMHLWPQAVDFTVRGAPLFVALGVGLNLLFLRALLRTRERAPRIDRLLLLLLAAEWAMLPGLLFGDLDFWKSLSLPQHFPVTAVMVLVGIHAVLRGVHAARYYTAAYFLLALGALGQGMPLAGIGLNPGLTLYLLPLGMLLNNLFLMAAAVDRVIGERRDKLLAQAALLEERAAQEATLQRTVDERTAQLNEALIETRKAHRAQSRLVAFISHDLRAPLATIVSCAQRLAASPDPEVRRHRTTVERSAQHQLELIDDLVEYARGELDRLELTPAPTFLNDWLDGIAAQAELLAARQGNRFSLDIDPDLPPVALFDPKRLRQVLLNLLGNAAKFTRDGEIRLSVRVTAQTAAAQTLEFAVEDTGSGIPEADIDRIFEPFERRKTAREGYGLGLSIARQIVRAMGGDLAVSSRPGAGSRFAFAVTLPTAAEADVAAPDDVFVLPEPFGRGLKVLVADDDAGSREYLCEVLASAEFDVAPAIDGAEALRLCEAQRFDLLLLDQDMPGMSGWDVLRALHVMQGQAAPPAVLCSATRPHPPADFPSGIAFAATLLKPATAGKLLQTLKEILEPASPISPAPETPPDAELASLRALIAGGDITEIEEWAEQLRNGQPRYAEFAGQVREAALRIDLPELERLADARNTRR